MGSLVWTQACKILSLGPCSLQDCCAVSDSMGGGLSLLAPYEDAVGLLHEWGGEMEREADMEKPILCSSSAPKLLPPVYAGSY